MGEARRRGNAQERVNAAIKRDKAEFYRHLGFDPSAPDNTALRKVLEAFLAHMADGEWEARKAAILQRLTTASGARSLADAPPIRDEQDEMAWYLYLAELAITDPFCLETNQAARALPFLAAIGNSLSVKGRVNGLDAKLKELLTTNRSAPDGVLFEVIVALRYASAGWDVQMLAVTPPLKSPDLLVRRNGKEFYVECKRQSRRPVYTEKEHLAFLRLWDGVPRLVRHRGAQWLWFDMVFHEELDKLPQSYLHSVIARRLPIGAGVQTLIDDAQATIRARRIDHRAVRAHMSANKVKQGSSLLRSLLGGDWAPLNTAGPMALEAHHSTVVGCESTQSGRWVDDVRWAVGATRSCDAPQAIAAKARDVKRLLVDALRQLPVDKPSIIHIAIETAEGRNVDRLRAQRIRKLLANFQVDRPVAGVFVHSLQCNDVIDSTWEVDETVDSYFWPAGEPRGLPKWMLVAPDTVGRRAAHWELY